MTYNESAALMVDMDFRGRIKVACLKFADSIMNDTSGAPGHNTLLKWAQTCFQSPDAVAQQTQPPTVMDGAVQAAGKDITDAALQGSVEAVIKKSL